jgi:putative ABC transport system substrate-binding protein
MNRRDFLRVIAGSAGWPWAAWAQDISVNSRIVGYLSARSEDVETALLAGVRRGLQETGYSEGRNLIFAGRWAEGHYERLPAMAAELVKLKAGVIITSGGPQTARVATVATNEIPIVFLSGSDPVTDGLIKSHNRPGGNITGVHVFTVSLGPKRLDFLRQLVPHGTRFGFLVNAVTRDRQIVEIEEASRAAGVSMRVFSAGNEAQLDEVFARLVEHRIEGLLMSADLYFQVQRDRLVSLAAQHSVPVMYEWSDFVVAGGLASYSSVRAEGFVQVGVQAGRILNGANPGDLPIVSSTKFEFVINLKTARSLGIQISPALLARADEVIE